MKESGTLVNLGCPNHDLSTEFLKWLYPRRTVPGGASCMVFPEHYKSPVGDWLEPKQDSGLSSCFSNYPFSEGWHGCTAGKTLTYPWSTPSALAT